MYGACLGLLRLKLCHMRNTVIGRAVLPCSVLISHLYCRYKPNPRLARAIDIMFTLHAEHEMNCSTAAARHLASSGVDVYTAIAGVLLSLMLSPLFVVKGTSVP